VYCSVAQCVAVCCSVLQCVAVCCSVLQCVAVWCSVLPLIELDLLLRLASYGVATISRHLKIMVSCANEPYKRDYILQKRTIILRSLLIVATP